MSRTRYNVPEAKLEKLAGKAGWRASKRGWPDFVCYAPDGEIIAVECKPRLRNGDLAMLRVDQEHVMRWLTTHGIRCFVTDGETLEPFDAAKHAPAGRRRYGVPPPWARRKRPLLRA